MSRDELINEVMTLRTGIRQHRDTTGHNLCWYHPELWLLLPEKVVPESPTNLPPKPEFLERCNAYYGKCENSVGVLSNESQEIFAPGNINRVDSARTGVSLWAKIAIWARHYLIKRWWT